MQQKQLLIAGIDPGTTLGYAAIDFEGNLIKAHSEKNLDLNSLISELISLGKPLIVAGDKKNSPDFINRLAVKLGSRVISPDYDLKVIEKREIAKGYETKSQHEADALASALFALKKITPLLKKITVFTEHYKKTGIKQSTYQPNPLAPERSESFATTSIKQQLIELVVGKELNIKDAAEIIGDIEGQSQNQSQKSGISEWPQKPQRNSQNQETAIIRKVVKEKKLTEKDFLTLYKKFKVAKKDIFLLKEQNRKLEEQIAAVKKDYGYIFRQMSRSQLDKKMQSLLDFREKRIRLFDKELEKKQEEIKSMQDETTQFLHFLSNMNSSVLLKKLDNLGSNEYEKKKALLNIKESDILLIEDPCIISEKTIAEIKNRVNIIFYKKPISKKIESQLPFIFININDIAIEENSYFAIAGRKDFERIKNKKSLLNKIVEDYRRGKEN